MRKYKIGITFNLEAKVTDIWANGANQNVIHLYHLFQHSDIVDDVVLVSWGPENRTTPPDGFMLNDLDLKFAYVNDVIDELDVLIEGTLSIEPALSNRMHEHGGKVVCYKMGPDYIMDIENFIFNQPAGRVFNGSKFDSIWLIPQNENTCRSYFSIMFNFIGRTKMLRDRILSVEGRYQMPDFLARYTDIVLAHQWENGLNYAYNDALYGGYPFVHNSTLLPKGVGYYYEGFDAFHGADVLLNVIDNHDKNHEAYQKRANAFLETLLPSNPINIAIYEREIQRLFEE